jgi:ornithine cyclodeaminase/alanine dehydrogenase-like protein (mu-crystallin family)
VTAPVARFVGADELRAAVRLDDLVDPVALAYQESSAGHADNGLIVMFPAGAPELGDVYVKTGTLRDHAIFVVKVSPWSALNVARGQPQGGFVAVFDSQTGHTRAILNDEHYLSDVRTAAAGALAARMLAPRHVATAAVLGAGVQAFWQPQALYQERPFDTLIVWARDAGKAASLAARLQPALPDVTIHVNGDLERTVRTADVLITATASREPLVHGTWLREGQHITAIGADDPTKRELDSTALRRARVFVDDRDTNATNGDLRHAIQAGEYHIDQVSGELGDILAGRIPARRSDSDITIAKLVGIGAIDVATAETALRQLHLLPNDHPGH